MRVRVAATGAARGVGVRTDTAVRLIAVVLNWNGGEDTVRVAEDGSGPDPRPRPLLQHLHPAPVPPDVHQDAIAL